MHRNHECKIFPHRLINGVIFEKKKKVTVNEMCVWISLLLSETFLIIRKTERNVMKNVCRILCRVLGILVRL